MSRFAILLGGDVVPTARLLQQLESTRVIAADSGIAHAAALGLEPELWVGDFDSAGTPLAEKWAHVPRVVFPAAKDATDGELAIDAALARGATELLLVGAFGGQFDHAMSHVMALLQLAHRGIRAICSSGTEEAHPLQGQLDLPGLPAGTRLSIIPLTDLTGLDIAGVRWPLAGRNVERGSTLTLSNATVGDVSISLQTGEAVAIVYPPGGRQA